MTRRSVFGVLVLLALMLRIVPASAHAPLPAGIVSVDTMSHHALRGEIEKGFTEQIPWAEAYGNYTDVPAYVPGITVDDAWNYIQDIYNLQQWTMSVRNLQPMPPLNGRTRYTAEERLPPGGNTYFLEVKNPSTRTIDWWVGHTPDNIWMHYYFRVLDAQQFVGKPGVLITWVNFGHANFDLDPYLHQAWLMMEIAHGLERDNLVKILQWRAAGNTGPLDLAAMQQLQLVNVELYDPMLIWGMIASQVAPTVPWDSHYGQFIGSHFYLPEVDPEATWNYLRVPENMNAWTVSLRQVRRVGQGLVGVEHLAPHGLTLGDMDVDTPSRTIDLRMAKLGGACHGAPPGLWMNSTLRVMDAPDTNGKPGTVVVWISYRHARYDSRPDLTALWKYLPSRNKLAAQNISLLLTQP